jgi:hypothetical protein
MTFKPKGITTIFSLIPPVSKADTSTTVYLNQAHSVLVAVENGPGNSFMSSCDLKNLNVNFEYISQASWDYFQFEI